ncbi:MAG: serine hydrolase [Thermoanaerobaculia bacterium]
MRLLVSLLLLSLNTTLHAAEPVAKVPPLGTQAVAWAKSLGHGAVATAEKRDGRWTFAMAGQPFAAGHAEVPPERVIFEIGSMSKVFTGILLAQSVAEGKLGFDDTLAKRLPVQFEDPAVGAVTLKQLATHTSCLPRLPTNLDPSGEDPYAAYDDKALFEYLAKAKLGGKAPCAPEYSNLGFGILGVVLEKAFGKPWAALVQERIAGPLGMADTVQDLSKEQQARFAEPWAGDQPAHPWTLKAIAGAGALRSTLADMSRFADALIAGSKGPLGPAWPLLAGDYVEMPAAGAKIGLALFHARTRGQETYTHDGGTGGFRSDFYVRPAIDTGAVVLASNAAAELTPWLIAWESSGTPPVARSEVPLPKEVLDEYAGVYALEAMARLTFLRRGDGLVARLTGQPFFPVFPSARDELFYKVVDAQLSFRRDASGKVDGVTLHQNGRDLLFLRAPGPVPTIEFLAPAALTEYTGEYDFGQFQPGAKITVTAQGDQLRAMLTGQPAFPVFAVGKDRFAFDVVEASLTFERDAAGKVVAVVLHQNGMDMRAPSAK